MNKGFAIKCLINLMAVILIVISFLILYFDLHLATWLQICAGISYFFAGLMTIFMFYYKKMAILKTLVIIDIFAIILVISYYIVFANGWLEYFNSVNSIKELILSTGSLGRFVFLILQFLQVVLLPIPSMITTLAGVAIFGALEATILSLIGIILGSIVSFLIGRLVGRKLVVWVAGKETTDKYCKLLNDRGKFLLILMFLFPIFPDDLLCMIAGITTMTMRFFALTVLFTRPIGILATTYLSSGLIVPFSGWGLFVWPFLILLLIGLFIACWKYQEKIEKWFLSVVEKKAKKKHDKKNANKKDAVKAKLVDNIIDNENFEKNADDKENFEKKDIEKIKNNKKRIEK